MLRRRAHSQNDIIHNDEPSTTHHQSREIEKRQHTVAKSPNIHFQLTESNTPGGEALAKFLTFRNHLGAG